MDQHEVRISGTPNPNAKKFIVGKFVKDEGKATFNAPEECAHIELARALLGLRHVSQVHFFDNVITITQNGESDWPGLATQAQQIISQLLPTHNPKFSTAEQMRRKNLAPELQFIEEILDRDIRPSLRSDGGDVEVAGINNLVLTIRYQGACGSCPSSEAGTLEAIKGALRSEFHPDLDVVIQS